MAEPAGYSGKPLAAKLGVKAGWRLRVIDPPGHLDALLSPASEGMSFVEDPEADLTWLFVRDRQALARLGPELAGSIGAGKPLWISWPKKSSGLFRDLTEDGVREVMLPTGLVDIKVCAVDGDWSGLKFARRRS